MSIVIDQIEKIYILTFLMKLEQLKVVSNFFKDSLMLIIIPLGIQVHFFVSRYRKVSLYSIITFIDLFSKL